MSVGASAGEAATGVVEAARDGAVDDVVPDLDADATEDVGVDYHVEVHVTTVGARERTGQPLEQIEKDTERDRFMSAEDAVKYGLIDKVLTSRESAQGPGQKG